VRRNWHPGSERIVSWQTFWLFVTVSFFVSATPGPNMLLVMGSSARFGFRAARATMAGCLSALLTMMAISAAGLGALLQAFPSVFDTLRWAGAAVAMMAAWFAAESLWIRPHYLAYFNEIVGPRDAWRHLVDSSLDWGQDLPSLRSWLDAHPSPGPVFISYFGSGDIDTYGIRATRVGDINFDLRPRKAPAILSGGLWIISVTQFQQVYTEARGPWDVEKERTYRGLLARVLELERTHGKLTYREGVTFEEYQFARLCHVLRAREPLARPAYTFLVYRLTDKEVMRALYEPVPIP